MMPPSSSVSLTPFGRGACGRRAVQCPPGPNPGKGPANALLRSFAGLRVIDYQDTVDISDWGAMKARIGRIAAQKD
jgi:hypothetical protein